MDIYFFVKNLFSNTCFWSTQEAYDNCDFEKAKKVTKIDHIREYRNFWFHVTEAGTFFFMDKESCNTSTPLKVVAHVAEPGMEKFVTF